MGSDSGLGSPNSISCTHRDFYPFFQDSSPFPAWEKPQRQQLKGGFLGGNADFRAGWGARAGRFTWTWTWDCSQPFSCCGENQFLIPGVNPKFLSSSHPQHRQTPPPSAHSGLSKSLGDFLKIPRKPNSSLIPGCLLLSQAEL